MMKSKEELDDYLAKIRKTIADSKALVDQAELRFAETDRLLASQGVTREQVRGFRFTERQREAVNNELRRMGMEALEDDSAEDPYAERSVDEEIFSRASDRKDEFYAENDELANRRMKFSMMMKPFRI